MNDKIVVFRGREELDAKANLCEYIRVARDEMTAFGADLPFDANIWDVTRYMVKPGTLASTNAFCSASSTTPPGTRSCRCANHL